MLGSIPAWRVPQISIRSDKCDIVDTQSRLNVKRFLSSLSDVDLICPCMVRFADKCPNIWRDIGRTQQQSHTGYKSQLSPTRSPLPNFQDCWRLMTGREMNDISFKLVATGAGVCCREWMSPTWKWNDCFPKEFDGRIAGIAEGKWEGNACSLKRRGRQGGEMLKEAGRPHAEQVRKRSGSLP